ncbi:MAG: PIN domain-containing protein [Thermoplasmatales archaeon]
MIIVDTNALIYSVKQKVNLSKFVDEDIAVPSSVIAELDSLSKSLEAARIARVVASRLQVLQVSGSGDGGVIEAAKRYGGKVLTNDRHLIRTLKNENVQVLSVSKGTVRRT